MRTFSCPACGAPLTMKSAVAMYAVCASCGSMVVRTGVNLEAIGKVASLPDNLTPLQVGTQFAWDGGQFAILGRTRVGWQDGAWNEWFVDDGTRQGWLAEAQGFLSIAFERPVPPALDGHLPALNDAVPIDGTTFRVSDVKEAVCLGSEGELPFAAPKGRTATYVDMLSQTEAFAGLEQSPDGRRLYVGQYAPFAAFRFENLRPLDGWTPARGPTQAGDPRYGARH